MHSVFVTGGTGFIGRHLVEELVRADVHVKCLVRRTSRVDHLQSPRIELVYADLMDREGLQCAISGADVVFHVAGLTHALRKSDLNEINGTGCGVIADACRRAANPPVLIHVSSLSAAGPTARNLPPITEEDYRHPISLYGKSKRCGEIELQKRAADLPCTIVRPGIVIGPHDSAILPLLRYIYRYRMHFVVGFRTPPLSLIYVEDLVRLLLQAADKGERLAGNSEGVYSPQGYYFACDDSEHPTYWELGQRFARALDRNVLVWPVWHWVGRIIGGTSQFANRLRGQSSILNFDKIREACASSWACSAQKARLHLDFVPADSLDVAFKKTADWYLQNVTDANFGKRPDPQGCAHK